MSWGGGGRETLSGHWRVHSAAHYGAGQGEAGGCQVGGSARRVWQQGGLVCISLRLLNFERFKSETWHRLLC